MAHGATQSTPCGLEYSKPHGSGTPSLLGVLMGIKCPCGHLPCYWGMLLCNMLLDMWSLGCKMMSWSLKEWCLIDHSKLRKWTWSPVENKVVFDDMVGDWHMTVYEIWSRSPHRRAKWSSWHSIYTTPPEWPNKGITKTPYISQFTMLLHKWCKST